MKAAPTLDGRMRIDPETDLDRWILRSIIMDANATEMDLTDRVSGMMDTTQVGDWNDYVVPELRQSFQGQLAQIATDISTLELGQPVFIEKEHAEQWYGGLNQARLALEEKYPSGMDEDKLDTDGKSARIRSHFYLVLQGLLLDFLM